MNTLKSAITGATTLAIVGAGLLLGAGAAHAAGTVSSVITGDPNAANGTISFYDATGNQITSGPLAAPFTGYAVASSATTRTGTTKATLFVATPDHTKTNSLLWFNQQLTAASTWPLAGAPAAVTAAEGAGVPAVAVQAGDGDLAGAFASAVNDPTTGFDHVMQVRMEDSGPGKAAGAPFWQADLYIDTTAGTWTQLYPVPPAKIATTISAITATPASPAPVGTTSVSLSATLSAADSSHPGGNVELFNGTTDVGPATLNAATGAITATATVANSGSYSYTFVYTPAAGYSGSTSPALAYSVNGPAVATTTVVSGPSTGTVGANLTYTATVSPAAAAGTVQFKVNGVNSGNPVTVAGGVASFTYSTSVADGGKNVVVTAAFIPADPTKYVASADATGTTTAVTAAAYNPDPQNVTVTVPAGTLVISTPYTVANPFSLGTLALSADGTHYSASANFGDPTAAALPDPGNLGGTTLTGAYPAGTISNGVTITDTRAASTGWTASVTSTPFTNAGTSSISSTNSQFSFTNVVPKAIAGNNLLATDVTGTPVPNLYTGGPFATTHKGPGTIAITGTLGLANVATSVQPGTYTATLTFTVA
jgi:hypothetical protein